MDKAARDNRANQLNPNHYKTGPGFCALEQFQNEITNNWLHPAKNCEHSIIVPPEDVRVNSLNAPWNGIKRVTDAGRPSGYFGYGSQSDRDNHANQLNPNNWRYQGNRPADSGSSGWCAIL